MERTSALQDALRELAEARRRRDIARERVDEYQGYVSATATYQELMASQKDVTDLSLAMSHAEAKVRELALAEHALTGEYKPADGVQIKEFSKVVYEPGPALAWCLAHATKYLVLDTKPFEKAASVLKDLGAPVELTKEARVTLATDLSAWLAIE